jgi:hypothetical protein
MNFNDVIRGEIDEGIDFFKKWKRAITTHLDKPKKDI